MMVKYPLSNMKKIPPARIALWYYWRWRIESFFKLLKGAGHNLEDWQQETGMAVAKRLLIASMACVPVCKIAHLPDETAGDLKKFIARLIGRQMKRNKPVTYPALLAGIRVFLSIMEVIESYPNDEWSLIESFFNRKDPRGSKEKHKEKHSKRNLLCSKNRSSMENASE